MPTIARLRLPQPCDLCLMPIMRGQRVVRKGRTVVCLVCGPRLGPEVVALLKDRDALSCNRCARATRDIMAVRVADEIRWICVRCFEDQETERLFTGGSNMQTQFDRSNDAVSTGDTLEPSIPAQ